MLKTLTLSSFAAVALFATSCLADPPAVTPSQTPPSQTPPAQTPPSATTAPTDPATTAAKPVVKDPVICHTEEVTGTRLGGHKVCKLKSVWDEESRAARQMIESGGRTGPHAP